jgi:CHAD domain-containing protein
MPKEKAKKTTSTVGELVTRACHDAALAFACTDPLGSAPATSRNVHDARVALRRVRSHLRTFDSLFPKGWADELRTDLSWYADELSHLRDLDVMTARVAALSGKRVSYAERAAACTLLTDRRSGELERLLELRLDPRHRLAVVRLEAVSVGMPLRNGASAGVAEALPTLLARPYDNLRDASRAYKKSLSDRRLHRLRIRAKELRYAAELSAEVFGEPASRVASAAEQIQTSIGDGRDALVAAAYLGEARKEAPKPRPDVGAVMSALRRGARVDRAQIDDDLHRLRRRWRQLQSKAF